MTLENKLVIVRDRETKKDDEKFIANYPNIRTLQGFLDGEWDLSAYDSCFKGRNKLGDVDATIELHGHTLVLEFKRSKWAMNKGQVLKAIRQAKYSNIVTFFIFGKKNEPTSFLQISPSDTHEDGYINSGMVEATEDDLKKHIIAWAEYTEINNLVESKTEEWGKVTEVMKSL